MAQAIEAELAERGMTQAAFCRLIGVTPKHLNQVLRGKANARLGQFDRWAAALGLKWTVELTPRRDRGRR